MTTLLQACREIVNDSIDHDYLDGETLHSVYYSEYGNYNGICMNSCTEYLKGLPSVCTVPFDNAEILQILESKGIIRKTDVGRFNLVERYWKACGYAFCELISKQLLNKKIIQSKRG